jgi:hypothetical protein
MQIDSGPVDPQNSDQVGMWPSQDANVTLRRTGVSETLHRNVTGVAARQEQCYR